MSSHDERVVEMRFDNAQFEKGVKSSMQTIEKFEKSLNFDEAIKGFDKLERASGNVTFSPLQKGIDTAVTGFNALSAVGVLAMTKIATSIASAGASFVTGFIQPMRMGFAEYETQMNAVQTILTNTSSKGTTIDDVNHALDELNKYADQTIYNFTQMTENIGRFTAAGVGLEDSVTAIKGISNLAAASGSDANQAARAMYNLSQAISMGKLTLMDWNSVTNAGMGGELFQESLKETARVHGVAVDDIIAKQGSFRDSLSEGWVTSEILLETLSKFTGDLTREELESLGYTEDQIDAIEKLAKDANDAATKVKTYTQLMDTLAEENQSGWTQSWEIIIGDFEEAKEFWSGIAKITTGVISEMSNARNDFLEAVFGGTAGLISKETWTEYFQVDKGNMSIEFLDALQKRVEASGISIDELTEKYGTFMGAVMSGEVVTQEMVKDTINGVGIASAASLDQIKELVDNIENGLYGDGDERRRALEEMGYSYEALQALVDADWDGYTFGHLDWDNLTEDQLRELGVTEEQIEAFKELQEQMNIEGSDVYNLLNSDSSLTGRQMLVDSITNAVQAGADVLHLFGEVWNEVFPPEGPEGIKNILEGILKFTESFQIFERTYDENGDVIDTQLTKFGEKVKIIFTGIADGIGIVVDAVSSVMDFIGGILSAVFGEASEDSDKNKGPLDFLVKYAEGISQLREDLKSGEFIPKLIDSIKEALQNLGDTAGKIIEPIKALFVDGEGGLTTAGKIGGIIGLLLTAVGVVAGSSLLSGGSSLVAGVGMGKLGILGLLGGLILPGIISDFLDLGTPAEEGETIFDRLQKRFDYIMNSEAIQQIKDKFEEVKKALGLENFHPIEDIQKIFENWNWSDVLGSAGEVFSNIGSAVSSWLSENGFDPIGWISDRFEEFKSWAAENNIDISFIVGIAENIRSFFDNLPKINFEGGIDPIGWFNDAIQNVKRIIEENTGFSFDAIDSVIEGISQRIDRITSILFPKNGDFVSSSLDEAFDKLPSIFDGLTDNIDTSSISNSVSSLFGTNNVLNAWGFNDAQTPFDGFQQAWGEVVAFFQSIPESLPIEEVSNFISGVGTTIQTWYGIASEHASRLFAGFQDAWGGVTTFFSGIAESIPWDSVVNFFNDIKTKIQTWYGIASEHASRLFAGFQDAWGGVTTFFSGIAESIPWDSVVNFFNDIKTKIQTWYGIASEHASRLFAGFQDAWGGVTTFFAGIAESIPWDDVVNFFNGIKEKIQTWYGIASEHASRLFAGFQDAWGGVTTFFSGIAESIPWDDIVNFFNGIKEKIQTWYGIASEHASRLFAGFQDAWGGVITFFAGIAESISWDDVVSFFNDIKTKIQTWYGIASEHASRLFAGFQDAWGQIVEFFADIAKDGINFDDFETIKDAIVEKIGAIKDIGSDIAPGFDPIRSVKIAWSKVVTFFTGVEADFGFIDGLMAIVEEFTQWVSLLNEAFFGSMDDVEDGAEQASDVVDTTSEAIEEANKLDAQGVADVFTKLNEAFESVFGSDIITSIMEFVRDIFPHLKEIIPLLAVYKIGSFFSDLGEGLKGLAEKAAGVKHTDTSLKILAIATAVLELVAAIKIATTIDLDALASTIPTLLTALGTLVAGLFAEKGIMKILKTDAGMFDGLNFMGIAVGIKILVNVIRDLTENPVNEDQIQQAGNIIAQIAIVLGGATGLSNLGKKIETLGGGIGNAISIIAFVLAIQQILWVIEDLANRNVTLEKLHDALIIVGLVGGVLTACISAINFTSGFSGFFKGIGNFFTISSFVGGIKHLIDAVMEVADYALASDNNKKALEAATRVVSVITGVFGAMEALMTAAGGVSGKNGFWGVLGGVGSELAGSYGISLFTDGLMGVINAVAELAKADVPNINAAGVVVDVLASIFELGSILTEVIGSNASSTPGTFDAKASVLGSLAEVAGGFGEMIAAMGLKDLIKEITNLANVGDPSSIRAAGGVVEAVAAIFAGSEGIFGIIGGVAEGLKNSGLAADAGMITGGLGEFVASIGIAELVESLTGLAEYDVDKLAAVEDLVSAIGVILGLFVNLGGVVGGVTHGLGAIGELATGFGISAAATGIATLVDSIMDALDKFKEYNSDELENAIQNVNHFLEEIDSFAIGKNTGEFSVGFIEGVLIGVGDWLGEIGAFIAEKGGELGSALWDAVVGCINDAARDLGFGDIIVPESQELELQEVTFTYDGNDYTVEMPKGSLLPVDIDGKNVVVALHTNGEVSAYWDDDPNFNTEWDSSGVPISELPIYDAELGITFSVDEQAEIEAMREAKQQIQYIYAKNADDTYSVINLDDGTGNISIATDVAESTLNSMAETATGSLASIGEDGGEDLIGGIQQALNDGTITADELAHMTEEEIRDKFGAHSPADLTIPIGEDLVEGIAYGVNQGGSFLIVAFNNMANAIVIFLTSIAKDGRLNSVGKQFVSSMASGIDESGGANGTLGLALTNMVNAMIIFLSNSSNIEQFNSVGKSFVSGIAAGIDESGGGMGPIGVAITNLISAAVVFGSNESNASSFNSVGAAWAGGISTGLDYSGGQYGTIGVAISNLVSAAATYAGGESMKKLFVDAGKNLAIGLSDGIDMEAWQAQSSAYWAAWNALEAVKNVFQSASPSKASRKLGKFFSQGLGLGITDDARLAIEAAFNMGSTVISAVQTSARLIDSIIEDTMDMQPTITPVVDLSNLQNANYLMDSAFRSRSVSLAYQANNNTDETIDPIDKLIDRLSSNDIFGSTNIYMDGATLNDDEAMRAVTLDFLYGLKRKAAL